MAKKLGYGGIANTNGARDFTGKTLLVEVEEFTVISLNGRDNSSFSLAGREDDTVTLSGRDDSSKSLPGKI